MAGIFKWRLPTDAELDLEQYEANRLDNETARVYARKYILGFLFVLVVCGSIIFGYNAKIDYSDNMAFFKAFLNDDRVVLYKF